jgi:hypothetical protein
MEINYQNKLEDWEEYYEFLLNAKEQGKKLRLFFTVVLQGIAVLTALGIGFVVWMISFGLWRDGLLFSALGFLILELMILIKAKFHPARYYGALILKRRLKNIPEKEKKIFLQPKKLSMDEDGLQIESSGAFQRWPWRIVEQMTLSPDLIIIQIDQRVKCLIPRRDFNPENGFLDFWQHALKYKEMKGS